MKRLVSFLMMWILSIFMVAMAEESAVEVTWCEVTEEAETPNELVFENLEFMLECDEFNACIYDALFQASIVCGVGWEFMECADSCGSDLPCVSSCFALKLDLSNFQCVNGAAGMYSGYCNQMYDIWCQNE